MSEQTERPAEVDITFFVPCLNEEKNVVNTIKGILDAVAVVGSRYEILIFDDHSSDRTVEVVEEFCRQCPELPVKLYKNRVTRGLGFNYVEGAFVGNGKYYMLVNGDNCNAKAGIVTILQKRGGADMVVPNYCGNDHRRPSRKLLSTAFTSLVNLLSGYSLRYYNGQVLHLRYNVMRWHANTHGFAYQAEIITRLLDEDCSYVEVTIPNHERGEGGSKALTLINILSVTHSLFQIFIRRMRRIVFER